ncbi:hypothetical protein HK098_003141 [Nowakowskiella sp. JEL0407]|nr:hypothetical protein HK098_003141 [Nowakowskiella sp. JEL0407]
MFRGILAAAGALNQPTQYPNYALHQHEKSFNVVVIDPSGWNNWPNLFDVFLHQNKYKLDPERLKAIDDDGTLANSLLKNVAVNVLQTSWEKVSRVFVESDQECFITAYPINASTTLSDPTSTSPPKSTVELTIRVHLIIIRSPVVAAEADYRHFLLTLMAANVPSVSTVHSIYLSCERNTVFGILKSIEQKSTTRDPNSFKVASASFIANSENLEKQFIKSNTPARATREYSTVGKTLLLSPESKLTTTSSPSVAAPYTILDALNDDFFAAPSELAPNLLGWLRIIRIAGSQKFDAPPKYRCILRSFTEKTSQKGSGFVEVACEDRHKKWADLVANSSAWGISTLSGGGTASLDLIAVDVIVSRVPRAFDGPPVTETIFGVCNSTCGFLRESWTEDSVALVMLAVERIAKVYTHAQGGMVKKRANGGFKFVHVQEIPPVPSLSAAEMHLKGNLTVRKTRVMPMGTKPKLRIDSTSKRDLAIAEVLDESAYEEKEEIVQETKSVGKNEVFYRVKVGYEPKLPGEIKLYAGNMVSIYITFTDGMCHGANQTTGLKGLFPSECLDEFQQPDPAGEIVTKPVQTLQQHTAIVPEPKETKSSFVPPPLPEEEPRTSKAKTGWKMLKNEVLVSKSFSGSLNSLEGEEKKEKKMDIWTMAFENHRLEGGLKSKESSKEDVAFSKKDDPSVVTNGISNALQLTQLEPKISNQVPATTVQQEVEYDLYVTHEVEIIPVVPPKVEIPAQLSTVPPKVTKPIPAIIQTPADDEEIPTKTREIPTSSPIIDIPKPIHADPPKELQNINNNNGIESPKPEVTVTPIQNPSQTLSDVTTTPASESPSPRQVRSSASRRARIVLD